MSELQLALASWVAAGVIAVAYMVNGLVGAVFSKRTRARREAIYDDLSIVLFESDDQASAAYQRIARTQRRLLLDTVVSLSVDLHGQAIHRLQQFVRATGLERQARKLATSRRWRKRVQAAQLNHLITHPGFDRSALLRDSNAFVRLRAAECLTPDQALEHLDTLLPMLTDPSASVQTAVQRTFLSLGTSAVAPLAQALNEGGPLGRSALVVASRMTDTTLLPHMSTYLRSSEPAVRALAATALGAGAGMGFEGELEALTNDQDAGVRAEAAESLARLGAYHSIPLLSELLQDSAWAVRRAAANALDELGPAGHLALRIQTRSTDRYARDMARLTLDAAVSRIGPRLIPPLSTEDDAVSLWRAPETESVLL